MFKTDINFLSSCLPLHILVELRGSLDYLLLLIRADIIEVS